jgi:uncharacterized membrane protein YkoI
MKKLLLTLGATFVAVLFLTAAMPATSSAAGTPAAESAAAQSDTAIHSDIPADLAKEAKVTLEAARATALAKVPKGVIQSEELEKEHGKLVYSFDISVPGKSGVEEVNVSAITGKVVSKHHESAAAEKKEKEKENKPPKDSGR